MGGGDLGALGRGALTQGAPRGVTTHRERELAFTAREQFFTSKPHVTDANDVHVEAAITLARDSADEALGKTPVAEQPLDARRHLGAMRERGGRPIERVES